MFDNEQLKTLAAKAVSQFVARGVPLTDAVVAVSRENKLNTEQTKRLVEASNQVAYLKILETAKDRTFSFPVANYDDVMAKITTPEGSMNKAASTNSSPLDIIKTHFGNELEKTASENEYKVDAQEFIKVASEQELMGYLPEIIFRHKANLEKIALEKGIMLERLMKSASEAKKDPFLGYKLQKFASHNTAELAQLLSVELEKVASERSPIFKERDFVKLAEVDSLLTEAKDMLAREEFLKGELEKLAFSGVIGRIAGSIFGKSATGVEKALGGKALTAYDYASTAKSIRPKDAAANVSKGYAGLNKAAAAPTGPTPVNQSTLDRISESWNKGVVSKLTRGKTLGQRVERAFTAFDYLSARPVIKPKDSVWDSLHNKGNPQ